MEKVKVLVVGTGFICRMEHLPALGKMPDVELVGIVSRSRERARELAERYRIKGYYSDYEEALEDSGCDAVDVTWPTYLHKYAVVEAAKRGKHVIVEKPIALRLKDADEMILEAKKAHVKFMVAHCLRYWPEYVAIKRLVEAGEVGEPRVARAYRLSEYPPWSPEAWHKYMSKSGGVIVDLSIHDIDYLRWLMGEVDTVFARGGTYGPHGGDAIDYAHIVLKFKSGAIGYVEGSWIMPKGYGLYTYFELAGTKGLLTVEPRAVASVTVYKPGAGRQELVPHSDNAYYLELRAFIDSVKRDVEPPISGEEAKRSLEVALAAIKSIYTGEPVKLPLTEEVIE